jgi:hypothetical protein
MSLNSGWSMTEIRRLLDTPSRIVLTMPTADQQGGKRR